MGRAVSNVSEVRRLEGADAPPSENASAQPCSRFVRTPPPTPARLLSISAARALIRPSVRPSTYPSSIQPSIHPPTHTSIIYHPPVRPPVRLSVHPSSITQLVSSSLSPSLPVSGETVLVSLTSPWVLVCLSFWASTQFFPSSFAVQRWGRVPCPRLPGSPGTRGRDRFRNRRGRGRRVHLHAPSPSSRTLPWLFIMAF